MRCLLPLMLLLGCNPDPGEAPQGIGYRDGLVPGEPNSGERGSVKISEILWSGSVKDDGSWDPRDVFVELRNESNRPVNISGWRLELEGSRARTWILPTSEIEIEVGQHRYVAAKTDGCFPEPDWVLPDLSFSYGDPMRLTLRDFDDRLIEPVGNAEAPPFAGGYDGAVSRSMERVELMFGGDASQPSSWHFYTDAEVDVPNDDRVDPGCRVRTGASPGRPNSPDYSGAFASGALD